MELVYVNDVRMAVFNISCLALLVYIPRYKNEFHYIMANKVKSFAAYFNDMMLLQMNLNWYKSMNFTKNQCYRIRCW